MDVFGYVDHSHAQWRFRKVEKRSSTRLNVDFTESHIDYSESPVWTSYAFTRLLSQLHGVKLRVLVAINTVFF